jgi:hypothetical protein
MTEKNDTASPLRRTSEESPTPNRQEPSTEGREVLVQSLRNHAITRRDPLAANLEMISADLMLVAHRQKEILEANLAAQRDPARQQEQFASDAERYLKFVRQIERLTRCTRELGRSASPLGGPR